MGKSVVDNTSIQCCLTRVSLDALNAHSCKKTACLTNQLLFFVFVHLTTWLTGDEL